VSCTSALPLKRTFQRELQDPPAFKILSGKFHEGETIKVDRGEEGLTITADVPAIKGKYSMSKGKTAGDEPAVFPLKRLPKFLWNIPVGEKLRKSYLLNERACYFALIMMDFGLTSSAIGIVMVRMPFSKSALALSALTSVGKRSERSKEPERCSRM
jgi:hypothetical protein